MVSIVPCTSSGARASTGPKFISYAMEPVFSGAGLDRARAL
jgi:hypothetical protein